MAAVKINGRTVHLPETTSEGEIRQAGGIRDGRNISKKEKTGNFMIPRGSKVHVKDGDIFNNSPPPD